MRGQFGLFAQPGALQVTGSLSRGERAGVRGQFDLIAQPGRTTVTGSLSRGERAGVRGQFGLLAQPGRTTGYWLPLPRGEGWGEGPARTVRARSAEPNPTRQLRRPTQPVPTAPKIGERFKSVDF